MIEVPTMLSVRMEAQCLQVEPREAAQRDGKLLADSIVTTRKAYPGGCSCCGGDIAMGQRSRLRTVRRDGEVRSWRYCVACCIAIAISPEDKEAEWTRRSMEGAAS